MMYKVQEVIIVEGKYDKSFLSSFLDAVIIPTDGFGIFSDKEKRKLIQTMADKKGIVILTDSDGGGFVIRNYLKSFLNKAAVKNAYIPEIPGKEKRKEKYGKEGILGVEGMSPEIVLQALNRAGVALETGENTVRECFLKSDLYSLGLLGGENSSLLRKKLCNKLGLPGKITSNALIEILPAYCSLEELKNIVETL